MTSKHWKTTPPRLFPSLQGLGDMWQHVLEGLVGSTCDLDSDEKHNVAICGLALNSRILVDLRCLRFWCEATLFRWILLWRIHFKMSGKLCAFAARKYRREGSPYSSHLQTQFSPNSAKCVTMWNKNGKKHSGFTNLPSWKQPFTKVIFANVIRAHWLGVCRSHLFK